MIIGVVVVVALLGLGGYLLFKDDDDKQVSSTVPTESVPEITTPAFTVPGGGTLPDLTIPDISLPDITLPEITIPNVTIPEITLPEITIPDFTIPEFTIPGQVDVEQARKDLTISESWMFPDPDSGDNSYEYGLVLANASSSVVYEYVEVELNFFDDAGRLVDTETQFFSSVLPGRNIGTGYLYEAPAPATRMETELVIDDFLTSSSEASSGTLTFDQLTVADTTDYSFRVNGQVVSSFPDQVDNVQVTGLWRDAAGAVIASETAYLDHVPPNTPTLFSIDVFSETLERVPPAEVYFSL